MCNKPKDEEYYQRQSNIGALLLQAYLDKYILESIDEFKLSISKETPSGIGNTIFMIAHICDLTKRDLALTLWKVFYDDSDDANTIKKLNRYLFAHYKIKYKIVETENVKKIRPLISRARHGFIAHNLMEDSGRVLQIQDLLNALEDIRVYFNNLSMEALDYRVSTLTDARVYSLSFYEKMGLDLMFQGFLSSIGT